jgi:hypothetical protein
MAGRERPSGTRRFFGHDARPAVSLRPARRASLPPVSSSFPAPYPVPATTHADEQSSPDLLTPGVRPWRRTLDPRVVEASLMAPGVALAIAAEWRQSRIDVLQYRSAGLVAID